MYCEALTRDPNCGQQAAALIQCATTPPNAVQCYGGEVKYVGCASENDAYTTCLAPYPVSCYAGGGSCDPTELWTCMPGQACLFFAANDETFDCGASGTADAGETCSSNGPLCGPGLYCNDDLGAQPTGTCRAYCCGNDPTRGCPAGQMCTYITTAGNGYIFACSEE
jgi:hypothetical protein